MNRRFLEVFRLISTVLGAVLFFTGERYFQTVGAHWWLTGAGLVLLSLGIALAVSCLRQAHKHGNVREEPSWRLAVLWQLLILGSALLYLIYAKALGTKPAPTTILEKSLLAAWLLFAVVGFFMGIGTEWSQTRNGRGPYAEPRRVLMSTRGWLKVGILAVVIGCLNYVAVKRNVVWDLSYLKTTSVSESTKSIADGLDQSVEVGVFFPQGNEVLSQARLYFNDLARKSAQIKLSYYDVELQPLAAESFKVSRNGYVVVKAGDQTERFDLGLTLTSARKILRNMDAEFQKALLAATEKRKVLYFTRGHGELSWTSGEDDSGLKSIKLLEAFLRQQNYTIRFFGLSEGAAKEVPQDADAVVIVGGDQPFMEEEVVTLKNFVDRGGKLFVLLDVDMPTETSISQGVRDAAKDPLVRWLATMGASFQSTILANASNYVSATRSEADSWFLFSNVFTSHESVQSLARNEQRAAVLTFRSGYLKTAQDINGWSVFDTVRSLSDTFADENRDFKFTEGKEKREPRTIGVAVEQKLNSDGADASERKIKGRVVVFSDATVVSDPLVRNQANLVYFVDALRWLVGESTAKGVASTEEDVRIRHTKKEDMLWFYGTIVFVPGLVLISGAIATRRAKRQRRSEVNK